jgi:hypothetical protein
MLTPPKTTRVSVPVTPEVLEKFQRFSELSGLSMGKAMGEWLKDTLPGLEAMTDILEAHKRTPSQAMQSLSMMATALQVQTGDVMAKMRKGPEPAPAAVAKRATVPGAVSARAKPKTAPTPRLVIRGVKSQDKGQMT